MEIVSRAAEAIIRGERTPIEEIIKVLQEATALRKGRPLLERVSGNTLVVGPIRGHACDFANNLQKSLLRKVDVQNVVFLGNYIDGAHQSLEVLHLIALLVVHSGKHIVTLMGKHELLYPIHPENFGSLRDELLLCASHDGKSVAEYERPFKSFFATLSVACVIDDKFFCVAGGPASAFRILPQIEAAATQLELKEFVVNEQMDEDEERMAEGSAFVASLNEDAFRFTFNAACNFITRNSLATMIVGMEYHTNRPDYDSFARPNHYKESIYFPGFMLGRIHPQTQVPAVITIFSAPFFCGVNRNNACVLTIQDKRLEIHELQVDLRRPLTSPGHQDHAFSWAQPMLERAAVACAREIIFGAILEEADEKGDAEYSRLASIATAKMHRMCQLLHDHDLPLPQLRSDKPPASGTDRP